VIVVTLLAADVERSVAFVRILDPVHEPVGERSSKTAESSVSVEVTVGSSVRQPLNARAKTTTVAMRTRRRDDRDTRFVSWMSGKTVLIAGQQKYGARLRTVS
jgi:hypothetical protein